MKTVEVSTKADFEQAVKNNAEQIIVTGDLAREIISAQKKKSVGKKVGIASGITLAATVVAGIVLAPVTAGASVAAASALTIGGVTATTAEVVIAASTILGVAGIAAATINTVAKNYDVKINAKDTTVECTRK